MRLGSALSRRRGASELGIVPRGEVYLKGETMNTKVLVVRNSTPKRADKKLWKWICKKAWKHREFLLWLFFKIAHHLGKLFGGLTCF